MKKLLILLSFLFICTFSFSQKLTKEIKISSKTLLLGGDYIIVPPTLGRVSKIISIKFVYVPNTTVYTISTTDTIAVVTDTPDGESVIANLTDSLFVKSVKHFSEVEPSVTYVYSNDIKITIPSGKLTLGDGDLYIEVEYELEQ